MKHLLIVLCLFMHIEIQAQNSSCEVNTGQRKLAGNYEIETIGSEYDTGVTVYDKTKKALSCSEMVGYVGFYYPDGSYLKKEFPQIPNTNAFIVKMPYPGFLIFKIILIIEGKIVLSELENV